MPRARTLSDYSRRILRVMHMLWQDPDDQRSLAQLAEYAHFSPYHFHRIYHAMTGETVNTTRQRLRLQRAALLLVRNDTAPLLHVAQRAGYQSSAAFVRAFRAAYGLPPGQYRRQHAANLQTVINKEITMYPLEYRELPASISVAALRHHGDYTRIGQTFDQLAIHCATLQPAPDARWFGLYYDDPTAIAPDDLRSDACVEIAADKPLPPGLHHTDIPAGRYAVILHRGPYIELEQAYDWLYGVWLPQSGLQPANRPCVEYYLNSPYDTAPKDLLTEIWLPL